MTSLDNISNTFSNLSIKSPEEEAQDAKVEKRRERAERERAEKAALVACLTATSSNKWGDQEDSDETLLSPSPSPTPAATRSFAAFLPRVPLPPPPRFNPHVVRAVPFPLFACAPDTPMPQGFAFVPRRS